MTSIQRNSVIIFFLAVAVRLVFHALTSFTADDAFITFRYADNIAAGHGFVYNLGQRVLGTSTPLFTFILSTLSALSVKPVIGALMIGLLCSGLTAVVIYRLAHLDLIKRRDAHVHGDVSGVQLAALDDQPFVSGIVFDL